MSLIFRTTALSLLILVSGSGCAVWDEPPGEPSGLPPVRTPRDSVGLEIGFVRVPPVREFATGQMWQEVDETFLGTPLRRRLQANGIRCGLFGSQMPGPLCQTLDQMERKSASADGSGVQIDGEPTLTHRHLQSRAGRRGEIVASKTCPEIAVLACDDGRIHGQTYVDVQCIWALKTYPQGDGRVRLELTPEVHHGQPVNRWVGQSEGVFRQVTRRDREVFEHLRIEATLSPGQTLLLAGTDDVKGLGRHFFTEPAEGDDPGKKLLLIRLERTQYDDRFAPGL